MRPDHLSIHGPTVALPWVINPQHPKSPATTLTRQIMQGGLKGSFTGIGDLRIMVLRWSRGGRGGGRLTGHHARLGTRLLLTHRATTTTAFSIRISMVDPERTFGLHGHTLRQHYHALENKTQMAAIITTIPVEKTRAIDAQNVRGWVARSIHENCSLIFPLARPLKTIANAKRLRDRILKPPHTCCQAISSMKARGSPKRTNKTPKSHINRSKCIGAYY